MVGEESDMTESAATRLVRELKSFYALSIMNVIFGAVAMALSVSFSIQNILALVDAMNLLFPQLLFGVLGFLAFGLSLRWLLTSVEILDGIHKVKEEYMKLNLESDDIIGLIIQAMAYYREKRGTMLKLITISKIAGICFILNGIIMLLAYIFAAWEAQNPLLSFVGILLNFAVGSSGIYFPINFERHVSAWSHRLQGSVKAEKDLAKLMEGS